MSAMGILRQLTPVPPVSHTLSRVVSSDHTLIGKPLSVTADPVDQVFLDTIDRKLEEVEWLLNYARNANNPIPVASAITTKKVNAPRRLTPMRLLFPLKHHQTTKSAHLPKNDPRRRKLPATDQICSQTCGLTRSMSAMAISQHLASASAIAPVVLGNCGANERRRTRSLPFSFFVQSSAKLIDQNTQLVAIHLDRNLLSDA
jgi:hypothetical protein